MNYSICGDIMAVLVKNAKSKVALENKHRYDTKYESSPDRVKYREELNQERRKRGIMGEGGPDVSHTSANTVTLENPHDNRARHFKERGTFKPIEKAWAFLKDDVDDAVSQDMDRVTPDPVAPLAPWEPKQSDVDEEEDPRTEFHPKVEALMRLLGIIV
tara:strand:+ start:6047 stop:6523 length:477 start_codon:yes stop_codon:yes gene_type:complete